ncbi:MAG: YbfB/YjiJ family MFS transporter [Armatimonadota bacterium]|nr:YbfB/YjiJ family MFS transporter [Armatimonadota bacterium]
MADGRQGTHYGWAILVVSTLVVFGSLGLARFGYTMVLPAMQTGLEMDNTQAGVLAAWGERGWRVCWYGFGAITIVLAAGSLLLLRNRPAEVGRAPVGAEAGESAADPPVEPLRWGAVYRAPAVWHLGLVYVAFGFSYIIYITFFVKALTAEGGYTPEAAGRLFMIMGWLSLLCGLIWGAVSDVIGRKGALVIVYLIHATAFGLFALWPVPTGFSISAILFGLSAWSIPAIMAAACGDMLGPRMASAALGFITLFFGVGQALGPTVGGAIADATGSLLPAMLAAAVVALLGGLGAGMLPAAREVRESGEAAG